MFQTPTNRTSHLIFVDVRLRKLAAEKDELLDELRHVKLELEEERGRLRGFKSMNGTDGGLDFEDAQRNSKFSFSS